MQPAPRPAADNGARWLDLVATRVNWPSRAPRSSGCPISTRCAGGSSTTRSSPRRNRRLPIWPLSARRGRPCASSRRLGSRPDAASVGLDTVNAASGPALPRRRDTSSCPIRSSQATCDDGCADVDAALTLIIEQAIDAVSSVEAANLRECEEASCRALFLDTTGRRRWCSRPACGVRARVRAYRARRATALLVVGRSASLVRRGRSGA